MESSTTKGDVIQLNDHRTTKPIHITQDEEDIIRRIMYPNVNDDHFRLFIGICNRIGLSPLSRQIYLDTRTLHDAISQSPKVGITVDGFRVIAERSGTYAGQKPVEWCGEDGLWKDVWLSQRPPSAARVGVMRVGFSEPTYAVARFQTYAVKRYDDIQKMDVYVSSWATMPELMIAKCAECLALRKAFPNLFSGLYAIEETHGKGFRLDGVYTDFEAEQVDTDKESPADQVIDEPGMSYIPRSFIDDDEAERLIALRDRVFAQGTTKIALKWAETSLQKHSLNYFKELLNETQSGLSPTQDE